MITSKKKPRGGKLSHTDKQKIRKFPKHGRLLKSASHDFIVEQVPEKPI